MTRARRSEGSSARRARTISSDVRVFTARAVLTSADELLEGGGLVVERGSIARVLRSRTAVNRACAECGVKALDLGDTVLAPGFVNAHSHLELSGLRGCLPSDGTFTDWIRALLGERVARGSEAIATDIRSGADRMLATGTTTSGDIDSSGKTSASLRGHPLRLRLYREVLDAGDPARSSGALSAFDKRAQRRARSWKGVSPHAPYTISPTLFGELGRRARGGRLPVSIHWAETREEIEWLERAGGPMSSLLKHSPHKNGLDLIAESGLLGPRTALIHGNFTGSKERERVAASGAALVHCPGTHAFFGRERFDLASWSKLGLRVALGTDSLASNTDLDMRREMQLLRRTHPNLAPAQVFEMATRAAARALCFEGRAGELAAGAWADLCAHATPHLAIGEVLEALTSGETPIADVWIAGQRVSAPNPCLGA